MAYDVTDFNSQVLERSREIPVLVDFWAPWCGPCRVLGPILDRLAAGTDKWELAKVDTDTYPDVSTAWDIRGIPAVKLFVDGKVTEEFTGALPEPAVRRWLEAALPDESRRRIAEAEEALAAADTERARRLLGELLRLEPGHVRARIRMAQMLALRDSEQAAGLLPESGADPDLLPVVDAIRTLAHETARDSVPEGPARKPYRAALQALRAGDFDGTCAGIVRALQADRYYAEDAPRRLGVALFTLLGPLHAVTRRHRRTFDMWLY